METALGSVFNKAHKASSFHSVLKFLFLFVWSPKDVAGLSLELVSSKIYKCIFIC